eukprot:1154236-Pelagomonas_calceolata.AAC.9
MKMHGCHKDVWKKVSWHTAGMVTKCKGEGFILRGGLYPDQTGWAESRVKSLHPEREGSWAGHFRPATQHFRPAPQHFRPATQPGFTVAIELYKVAQGDAAP